MADGQMSDGSVGIRQYFEDRFRELFKRLDGMDREMAASRGSTLQVQVQLAVQERRIEELEGDVRAAEDFSRRLLWGLISIGIGMLGYLLLFLINSLS